jgi:quinol monooxygenase YgiN
MIVEYFGYKIDNKKDKGEFESAYKIAGEPLRSSPHCLRYELSHCVEKPESYILRIEWVSLDGHMKGFRTSPEFQTFFAAVRPFFNQIEEMNHYEVTDIKYQKS